MKHRSNGMHSLSTALCLERNGNIKMRSKALIILCLFVLIFEIGFGQAEKRNETKSRNGCELNIPSSISANGGINDCWPNLAKCENILENYRLSVYNRNADLVFETDDVSENWICNNMNWTKMYKAGIYVFFLNYAKPGEDGKEEKGTVSLIY